MTDHDRGQVDDAAASLDAPFAMGAPGVLEGILEQAGVAEPEFTSIAGTGRFDTVGQWVTTEVRGWTLGESVSDAQLAALIDVANKRLAEFNGGEGCVFGMAAKVASRG